MKLKLEHPSTCAEIQPEMLVSHPSFPKHLLVVRPINDGESLAVSGGQSISVKNTLRNKHLCISLETPALDPLLYCFDVFPVKGVKFYTLK